MMTFVLLLAMATLDGTPPVGAGVQGHRAIPAPHGGFQAAGPGWHAHFDGRGINIVPRQKAWRWGLALAAYGWAGHAQLSGLAEVRTDGSRVTYTRGALEEWFVNGARGLEQGFTVLRPPDGVGQTLVFDHAITGTLSPRVTSSGTVELRDSRGSAVLELVQLRAWDALGRPLAASFEPLPGGGLRYAVDVRGARYPIVVDPFLQNQMVKATAPHTDDSFGSAVAMDGNLMVVGAPNDDGAPGQPDSDLSLADSGAAYVYSRLNPDSPWTLEAILKASNAEPSDRFGRSVAISGNTIVVGAPLEASNGSSSANNSMLSAGAVYVFVRSGVSWSQQAYLKSPSPDIADQFGQSVAISADTLAVGAPGEDGSAVPTDNLLPDSGAVFVFKRTGVAWNLEAYLKAANREMNDSFGEAVALHADTLVAGADNEAGNGSSPANNSTPGAGAAYVFFRTGVTWSQQGYLKATVPANNQSFGDAVDVSGDTVIVGGALEDGTGAVTVFLRTAGVWNRQAVLKADNAELDDRFGTAVAIEGNHVVVGARAEDSGSSNPLDNSKPGSGAAYVFVRVGTTWTQVGYLKAFNADPLDRLGSAVDLAGVTVVAGAPNESSGAGVVLNDNSEPGAGAVYSYRAFNQPLKPLAGTPQSTFINTAFATNLKVELLDAFGDPVPGAAITFAAPGAGPSGRFPGNLAQVNAVTNASGVATAPVLTANNTAGSFNVKAILEDTESGTFVLTNVTPTVQITVRTNINGPLISVDGGTPFTGAQTFTVNVGAPVLVTAVTPQTFNGGNSQYALLNWSDGGAASHTLTAPVTPTTFTANFAIQHRVTTSALPPTGGSVTPLSGFFDQGAVLNVQATPAAGFGFAGFTGALTGSANPQVLTVTAPATVTAYFTPGGAYQIRYVSNLNVADSVINLTNTGERGAGLAAGTSAAITGAICVNVYAFSPDEQMISCCSCPVTPNGLVSLSARQDLISNTLTPAVPTSMVVKLLATAPDSGSCANSAAAPTLANLAPGLAAWGTTVKAPGDIVETRFAPATLSIGSDAANIGELARLRQLCGFINANGSGFGICRSCRLGGLGAGRQ